MPKKDYRWQIYHIKGTPAKFIGTDTARRGDGFEEGCFGVGD
jgi:hypothetical protein